MKIEKCYENKAKISLSLTDLKRLGISFEEFESDVETTQLFLSNLIAVLYDTGMIICSGDDVRVDVIQEKNGSIIIYIEPESIEQTVKSTEIVFLFNEPKKLTEFCSSTLMQYKSRIISDTLFLLNKTYCLIICFRYAKSTIVGKKDLRFGDSNEITIAKIKEYGQKLSDTPLELIIKLS